MKKQILLSIVMLMLFALVLSGCSEKSGTKESTDVIKSTSESNDEQGAASEDKSDESTMESLSAETPDKTESQESDKNTNSDLYTIVLPKSLTDLSNYTPSEFVEAWNDETSTVVGPMGEDIPIKQMYTDVYINDEELLTYVFTAEQLTLDRQSWTYIASLHPLIQDSIQKGKGLMRVEYNDDMTECVLYACGYDNYEYSDATAYVMGRLQLANGTEADEWKAHVVVKDYETGKIISEDDYPIERLTEN